MKVFPFKSDHIIKKLQAEAILLNHKQYDPTLTSIHFPITKMSMQFDVVLLFPSHGFHQYLKVHHLHRKWIDGLIEYGWKLVRTYKSNDKIVKFCFRLYTRPYAGATQGPSRVRPEDRDAV